MKRKIFPVLPLLLVFLMLACAKVNQGDLDQITLANSDYDSVSLFTASQLASLKMVVDSGGTLSDAEKQRALDLYDVLTLLDTYRNTIQAMKIEPTAELLQQAVDTWNQVKEKATALGWGGTK